MKISISDWIKSSISLVIGEIKNIFSHQITKNIYNYENLEITRCLPKKEWFYKVMVNSYHDIP